MDFVGIFLRILGVPILFWFLAALRLGRYNAIEIVLIGLLAFILLVWGHKIPYVIPNYLHKKKERAKKKKNKYLIEHGELFLIPIEEIEIEGYSGERVIEAADTYTKSGAMTVLFNPSRAHDRSEYFGMTYIKYSKQLDKKIIEFYSDWIEKQTETILFKLENKESIKLYIDKEDINNYYMDIEWLK